MLTLYLQLFIRENSDLRDAGSIFQIEKPADYEIKKCRTSQNEEYEFNLMINKEMSNKMVVYNYFIFRINYFNSPIFKN